MRTEETERKEARLRGMNSLQELAQHRLTLKKELKKLDVSFDKNEASTEGLENKLLEAKNK